MILRDALVLSSLPGAVRFRCAASQFLSARDDRRTFTEIRHVADR